jgi:ATP-binding cassette subfamily C (CFTR/MRP) protein 1
VIQGHPLTPEVAFLSLMLFNLIRFSVYRIPGLVREVLDARISLNRVQEFLLEPEVPEMINTMNPTNENTIIELKDANFSWITPKTDEPITILPTIKFLNLEIKEGELIGIIGRVGSGKSSFLSSICGELYQNSGQFYRKPSISIAYVPQEAWIQNLSLKDNILFGKVYDEKIYQKTIEVCALKDDLKQFSAGDETEIGERGLNLSGGQKARVALARAVYQASDLYILDDTLSAVDSHVGTHIFQNVIGNDGILKEKTRIFALNSINFLSKCDKIIVLKEGNLVDFGTFGELSQRQNETFIELVKELANKAEKQMEEDEIIAEEEDDVLNELVGAVSIREHIRSISTSSGDQLPSPIHRRRRTSSNHSNSTIPFHRSTSQQPHEIINARLIEDEELAVGKVSYKMYWDYIKAFGVFLAIFYALFLFIFRKFQSNLDGKMVIKVCK